VAGIQMSLLKHLDESHAKRWDRDWLDKLSGRFAWQYAVASPTRHLLLKMVPIETIVHARINVPLQFLHVVFSRFIC
jgi:hypothetical protein